MLAQRRRDSSGNSIKSLTPNSVKIVFSDQLKIKPLLQMEEIFPANFCSPVLSGAPLLIGWRPQGEEAWRKEKQNRYAKGRSQVGTSSRARMYPLEAHVSLRFWEGGGVFKELPASDGLKAPAPSPIHQPAEEQPGPMSPKRLFPDMERVRG